MTIRTLHLINGLGTGGAERSLAEMLPDLRQHGIEPQVAIFHRRDEGVEQEVRASGIPVHHIDDVGWVSRVRAVRELVERERPDVLHTTIFEADVVGRVAARLERVPVLTSLVNTSYDVVRLSDPAVSRRRLRAAQLLDGATGRIGTVRFHAITEAVRDAAVRDLRIPADRIDVVPRGRRRERLGERTPARRRAVRQRLGLPKDAVVVLHVGRQEHQKGHDVLLRALTPVMHGRNDMHLLLAGRTGNATDAVRRLIRTLPASRVHELGHVDDVPDLLAAADLFVFPSRYEGLGGAALEAMALGVPIVASDVPALRELLAGVAVLVPANDVPALTAGVQAALAGAGTDPGAGSCRFAETYEHASVVREMAALLAKAATGAKSLNIG